MNKIYSIEAKDGITTISFSKTPELADFVDIIDELAEKDLYTRRLWNFNPHGFNMNPEQLMQIANYGKTKFVKPSKLAIVAPKDLIYGLSRLFEVYREEQQVSTNVFRNEKDAREWLME